MIMCKTRIKQNNSYKDIRIHALAHTVYVDKILLVAKSVALPRGPPLNNNIMEVVH